MFFLQADQPLLALRVVTEEQRGRFGKGPCEVRVPDLLACSPPAVASGFFRTCDQACVRDEVWPAWEAVHLMAFVEQYEAENLAHAGPGLPQGQGMGIGVL